MSMGGSHSIPMQPSQMQGEHANSARSDSNPRPFSPGVTEHHCPASFPCRNIQNRMRHNEKIIYFAVMTIQYS